jgi:hypothetical protein
VCAGQMDLADAQRAIATDWLSVYRHLARTRAAQPDDSTGE